MKKWILVSTGVLMVFVLAVGVSSPQAQTALEEVKFGYVTWLSGAAAVWGIPCARGVDIIIDDMKTEGGYWGKRGFTVGGKSYIWNVLIEDSAYNPDLGVKATHKLIYQDKVNFMLIGGGAIAAAAVPIVTKAGNVLAGLNAGVGKEVVNPSNPLVFKFEPVPADVHAPGLYEAMRDREGVKNVAILVPNDETGKTWGKAGVETAKVKKLKLVAEEYYERGTADFFPILTRILAKKPDLIDLSYGPGGSQAAIVKQAFELGYKGKWLLYAATPDDLVKIAGKEAVEGAYNWQYLAEPATDFQRWFNKEYTWRYGLEWNPIAMYHTGTIYGITLAIEKAQSFDPVKVADALEDLEWEYYFGPAHFSGEKTWGIKRVNLYPTPVSQMKDGKSVHAFFVQPPEEY